MKFRTEGLIIREQNIRENDKLIHVLTRSDGVIKAFARGAKSIKDGKSAATALLSYSALTFHTGRESYSVGDARTLHVFPGLRGNVKKMCLAQYFCELALTACPQGKSSEKYLSLMLNSLYLIDTGKRSEKLVKPCFEMRLAAMAGYLPNLIMCKSCGVYTAPVMYFFPRTGDIACCNCRAAAPDGAVELTEAALTALRHTVYADDAKLFSFAMSDEGLDMLNRASEEYLKQRFEKEFKTLQFYKTIC